ncbi:acyltransferase [Thermodesulfobacteriota bacterium]
MQSVSRKAIDNVPFFSHVRYLMILLVVVFHACMTHCNIYPGWFVSDAGSHRIFDIYMILSDIFMLPVLFFIAGFFVIPSIARRKTAGFIKGKLKRLGVPFIICVLLFGPIMMYLYEYQRIVWDISLNSYLSFWAAYLKSPVSLYVGPIVRLEQFRPFHYWFVSMLLVFFFVFVLFYKLKKKFFPSDYNGGKPVKPSNVINLILLLLFGLLTSIGFYAVNSIYPDYRWFTIGTFFTVQPTRLVLYIGYFALGVYAFSKKWFMSSKTPGYPIFWLSLFVLLLVVFSGYCIGGRFAAIPFGTFPFALIRSFLCLSSLMVFILLFSRFWNRSSRIDKAFSDNSYTIYLIHMPIVVIFQFLFILWKTDWSGAIWIKFGFVTFLSIVLSYGISAYLIKPVVRLPDTWMKFKKRQALR